MKELSKLIHGLVVIACSGLLLLPVSVNAFFVQYNDLADFSLSTVVTNDFKSNVSLNIDTQGVELNFGNNDPGFGGFNTLLNNSDATDTLLGGVSLNTNNSDYAGQFPGLYGDRGKALNTSKGAPGGTDDVSSGIKVPEPSSILLMGLGLIGLWSVARIRQGEIVIKK
jgi:hypothetical protein